MIVRNGFATGQERSESFVVCVHLFDFQRPFLTVF